MGGFGFRAGQGCEGVGIRRGGGGGEAKGVRGVS